MPAPAPCAQRKPNPASAGPVIMNWIGSLTCPGRPTQGPCETRAIPTIRLWSVSRTGSHPAIGLSPRRRSRLILANRRQRLIAAFIPGLKRELVRHQRGEVGGLGDREVGGQIAVQEARALELRKPWKVFDG